ncbi:acetylcholine receptor subunit beta-type unc-29-like [Mizuhopecten yessoensis]|uniref:acetylcholine receptor subunit beta-type unc-29-like n=1 Tax=Mizuhopecten yessoensis TaxID=6573 RepID=UPI000B45E2AA|nr:acetylcholine receptor subunit beta-type unc-29-like [Mizuhopecten yessoensis]
MLAYYPNLIWNVESTTKSNVVAGRLSKAMLYITISRRPTFMFLTLVLPIIALNYMNILVFLIPVESGEKISYAITVLLTFAVYLSVYSEKIPPLSHPVAIFSVSILIKLFTSCLIALCCVVISMISFYQQEHRVPSTVQQLTVCFLRDRRIRGVNKTSTQNDSTMDMVIQYDAAREVGTLCQDEDRLEIPTQVTVGWKEVTIVMDRLCLVLFAVTSTIETTVTVIFMMTRY